MTCYICQKSYARLTQHLRKQHGFSDTCIEPANMKEFMLMSTLIELPIDMMKYRKSIFNYIHNNKDMPIPLYNKMKKHFKEYKAVKGVKPKLCIAQYNKIKTKAMKNKKQTETAELPSETIASTTVTEL